MIAAASDWLTPARRRRIYTALSAIGGVLTVAGLASPSLVSSSLGITQASLSVLALLLASWRARRADWTALYAGAAALITALRTGGILLEGQASHWLDVLSAACAAAPLIAAALRTDPATPTGEPATEYTARHSTS